MPARMVMAENDKNVNDYKNIFTVENYGINSNNNNNSLLYICNYM